MIDLRLSVSACAICLLSACASWWHPQAETHLTDPVSMAKAGPELPPGKMGESLAQCYQTFAATEASRREAGVLHASYFQVKDFPFLRVDRLMASYAGDIKDENQAGPWLESMREYAHFSRGVELSELNMERVERSRRLHDLSFCSVWLSLLAFDQEKVRNRMIQAIRDSVPQPADPVSARATIGLDSIDPAQLKAWRPVAAADAADVAAMRKHFDSCDRDPLGRVGLISDEWLRLAAVNAPLVLTPKPLTGPTLTAEAKVLNNGSARMHYQPMFVRVGNQTLLQFAYYIWLSHDDDPASGFDGLIWRVTLDLKGQPLVYDSISLDGANHQWFAAQELETKGETTLGTPQLGTGPVALTLSSQGQLVAVSSREDVSAENGGEVTVVRYDDLAETHLADGRQRSMFDSRGRLRSAGPAVYMLGQHPAIDKQKHTFDDPRLVDMSFTITDARLLTDAPPACKERMPIASNTAPEHWMALALR